jgi:hypothetical protein
MKMISVLVVALLLATTACAGTVYKWTDARGVVHYGDVPPPKASGIQTENMPDAPPPLVRQPIAPAAPPIAPANGQGAKAAAPPDAAGAPSGPAKVVLVDRQAENVSPTVQSFRGRVKNQGGAEARDVYVAIRVTEPTQGDECVRDEIDVEPSTLGPGAEGTFEAEFDSPCFHGPVKAELSPEWQ